MLEIAKEKGVYITVRSDSHFYVSVGEIDQSTNLLEAVNYPKDKIITNSL